MYEKFWKIRALPSTQILTWRVLQNRVTSKDNLYKRKIKIGCKLCVKCFKKDESINHLSFNCRVTGTTGDKCDNS